MIVTRRGPKLRIIRQTDHAGLSGVLARHWGNTRFAPPEPAVSVGLAATLHDIGWENWDEQPRVNPQTHQPYQFTELPVEEHLGLYMHGVERVTQRDPYAGLLVSMHCEGLYNQRFGIDASLAKKEFSPSDQQIIQEFVKRLQSQQKHLREQLTADSTLRAWATDKTIWTNYKLLQIFDRLSLYLCMDPINSMNLQPAPLDYQGKETTLSIKPVGKHTFTVSPFPFLEDPVPVSVEARILPQGEYAGDGELRSAYEDAPPIVDTMELRSTA